jgi:glutathione S-transferase
MEPILLYGHPQGSSLGLVAALEWLGQPYRLSRVAMPDDMLTDSYKRFNGRQETPVLITADGTVLSETMAIAFWLEARDDQRRISFSPGTPQADRLHQYVAFINTSFTSAFSPLWAALEMSPSDPAFQEALRRFGRDGVAKRHRQLDEMIGDSKYMLGEKPTLADAVFVGVARWANFHQAVNPKRFPRIDALRQRLEADPAVRFAQAIEDGDTPTGSGALRGHVPLQELLQVAA